MELSNDPTMPAASLQRPAPSKVRTWLQLLRAPNLFTVPGDPLTGYLVSNAGFFDHTIFLTAAASICFYAAGLLMNDVVDLAEDAAERPSRPLPAGDASAGSVKRTLWALNAAGLLLLSATGSNAALLTGACTVASVWSYNVLTKKIPVIGALNMGLCRALSVMIGAMAGPAAYAKPIAAILALMMGLFIAAVTNLARFETRQKPPLIARFLPVLPLMAGSLFGMVNCLFSPDKAPGAAAFGVAGLAGVWLLCKLLVDRQAPLPPLIGAHIRLLLPLQAGACWLGASQSIGPVCGVVLLACWPLSIAVSKRFYAS
jgi:4-hydroxybenzoate polyprenyltransferase